jgi:hypothetical protein
MKDSFGGFAFKILLVIAVLFGVYLVSYLLLRWLTPAR